MRRYWPVLVTVAALVAGCGASNSGSGIGGTDGAVSPHEQQVIDQCTSLTNSEYPGGEDGSIAGFTAYETCLTANGEPRAGGPVTCPGTPPPGYVAWQITTPVMACIFGSASAPATTQ
jgi:hypothetical protein